MDVQFVPKPALSSGSGATQQPSSTLNTGAESSAKALINNAVPVPQETTSPSTERRQDKLGKQQDESVTAQQAIESLRLTNRRTQLDFNTELNTVFLQIVDTRTEEVVDTIPPEELVRQLQGRFDPPVQAAFEDSSGGIVIDRSV
jgi:uncharacterized FlaG/YvyC family protein